MRMPGKVLFLDPVHPFLQQELERLGFECRQLFTESRGEVLKALPGYAGVVIKSRLGIDREFLDHAVSLRFILRAGAGMENIDVEQAESKGIKCFNAPEGNKDAVGEHAIGMLLALFNKITIADREVRAGLWNREGNRGHELAGKTVGIIGYGNTGRAFSRKIENFDVHKTIYDKYIPGMDGTLEELYEKTDILSLHVPLTKETYHLVNDEFLNKFKKNIFLINTSRGKIVKTEDIVYNLRSGKVLGACLDVLEYESSSFEGLKGMGFWFNKRGVWWNKTGYWLNRIGVWKYAHPIEYLTRSKNVVLTPHIAGWTYESNEKIARALAEKVNKWMNSGG